MDAGPLPRVVDGRLVVVHGLRRDRAGDAVLEHDVADGDEERPPVLVQRDDAHHHEVVEVHLDESVGEMHEDGRARQQSHRGEDRGLATMLAQQDGADAEQATIDVSNRACNRPTPCTMPIVRITGRWSHNRMRIPRWRRAQTSSESVLPRGRNSLATAIHEARREPGIVRPSWMSTNRSRCPTGSPGMIGTFAEKLNKRGAPPPKHVLPSRMRSSVRHDRVMAPDDHPDHARRQPARVRRRSRRCTAAAAAASRSIPTSSETPSNGRPPT